MNFRRDYLLPAFAAALALFACYFGLGAYGLLDNNEGLYASIARDMANGSGLIIPHLNGVPYIEKPPMLYWLMALSFHIFGVHEWSARLVPATSFLATIAMSALFLGRRQGSRAGAIAALIASSSIIMIVIGREIICDMLFTALVSATLLSAFEWYESRSRTWLLTAYAFLALALLTKGFTAAVLVGGVALTFFIAERATIATWKQAADWRGILLMLAIAAPWHILATLADPGFAWFYFINEHVLRFLNLREPHDYYNGPWWYYVPRLFLLLLPWTLFLPLLRRESTPLHRFLWCWLGWMLFFFSLSDAKANYYMIVGMPPLAMLLADAYARRLHAGAIVVLSATVLVLLPVSIGLVQNVEQFFSQKQVAAYLSTHDADMPTAIYRDFEEFSAFAFYLDKQVTVVNSESGDLLYGQKNYPQLGSFKTLDEWLKTLGESRLIVRNIYMVGLHDALAKYPHIKVQIMPFVLVSVVKLEHD